MTMIKVTVIYALSDIQYIEEINIRSDYTVKDAILTSNLLNKIKKNIQHFKNKIGIYNKLVHLNTHLKNGDRIEIYRNLIIDPKERRKKIVKTLKKNKFVKN
ncbi:RnfH family protein [Buchnera aphidicola]|uniref:RnfH family protein n=1 Tax=Buchnera aphidicola TaxID=9 RepID=UPI0034638BC0